MSKGDGLGWIIAAVAFIVWGMCLYAEGIEEGRQRVLIEYDLGVYDEKTGEFIEYKKEQSSDGLH